MAMNITCAKCWV